MTRDALPRSDADHHESARDIGRTRTGALQRLGARLRGLSGHQRAMSARSRQLLFGAAALILIVATIVAYRQLPNFDGTIAWQWLALLVVVGVPATVLANAAEYAISAKVVGHHVGWSESIRLTLIATTANMLPMPGAALVRTAALRRKGSTYGGAISSTAVVGFAWVGTTAMVAATILAVSRQGVQAAVLVACGTGVLVVASMLLIRQTNLQTLLRLGPRILLVECATVAVGVARFSAVLLALGYGINLERAIGLVAAGVVAAATGVFPGGIGIRELLAAAISPLVGMSAAVGLFATAVNRVAEGVALLPCAVVFAVRGRNDPERTMAR